MGEDQWIFGYGSLVWRPAFDHRERRAGFIRGFARRFWQASPDHRGTPEAPGRVVTLVEQPDEICWGVAYRVPRAEVSAVLAELDYREKAGYRRVDTDIHVGTDVLRGLVYIAREDNPNFLGPLEVTDIARVVLRSHGPSGPNVEYVTRLAEALAELGVDDPHVFELARLVTRG